MAGLLHVHRARKRSTKFTPRASWGRTIFEPSRRRPKALFRRRSLTPPRPLKPKSHEEGLRMKSQTYIDRALDARISDALIDLALDMKWSFNHAADRLWEKLD